jgi:hypothetical protein
MHYTSPLLLFFSKAEVLLCQLHRFLLPTLPLPAAVYLQLLTNSGYGNGACPDSLSPLSLLLAHLAALILPIPLRSQAPSPLWEGAQ